MDPEPSHNICITKRIKPSVVALGLDDVLLGYRYSLPGQRGAAGLLGPRKKEIIIKQVRKATK